MNSEDLKKLVRESVQEVLSEKLTDLERLSSNINPSTMVGNAWHKTIMNLETVYDEVKDFQDLYQSHQNRPPTVDAQQKLDQVIKLLEEIRPTIEAIHQVQRREL